MRPTDHLARATDYLERHGVQDARRSAEILLSSVLETDRAGLYVRSEDLSAAQAKSFGLALCQRCEGVPLQHLTGDQPFRGLDLEVRPGVFIPRPETEEVVGIALDALDAGGAVEERSAGVGRANGPIVVDIGTGTGAIALSIKHAVARAQVWAVDRSPAACALALANSTRLGLPITVLEGNLFDPLPVELRGQVSLVISNPPYVTPEEYDDLPEEVKADPFEALVDGLPVYRRLIEEALKWLQPRGLLVLEIGHTQAEDVVAMCAEAFDDVLVHPDLANRPRVVTAVRR